MGTPRKNRVPTDRGLQYGDISHSTRQKMAGHLEEIGNAATNFPTIRGQVEKANPQTEKGKNKKRQTLERLDRVEPYVRDVPMNLDTMTERRVEHFTAGIHQNAADQARGIDTGDPHWYLEHGGDIANIVEQHGRGAFPLETAVNASVVMSQGNEPIHEKQALAHLLTAESSRVLDTGSKAEKVQAEGMAGAASHSGTERNLGHAVGVLRGEHDIDLFTSPKFEGYRSSIQAAASASEPEKEEYRQRVGHVRDVTLGKQIRGQEYLDLTGHKESKEGILNPTANTAEDSWQSAVSMGQDIEGTVPGGKTNVAKAMADTDFILKRGKGDMFPEHQDVSFRTLYHAVNNEATVRAAAEVSNTTGLLNSSGEPMLPSMAMQEGVWIPARRTANKDPQYNAEVRQVESGEKAAAKTQAQTDRRLTGGK